MIDNTMAQGKHGKVRQNNRRQVRARTFLPPRRQSGGMKAKLGMELGNSELGIGEWLTV